MRAASPTRVLIADDHAVAREGLRALLERTGLFDVVADVPTAEAAIDASVQMQPDLAFVDIRFARGAMDGLEATRRLAAACPNVRVIILSLHDEPAYVRAAVGAGARGYVLKDATPEEILEAARTVLRGYMAVPLSLLQQAVTTTQAESADAAITRLSPRELEVLEGLALGLTNKEIAGRLGITPGTVKVHVERVIAKLDVRDRTQAAVVAVQHQRHRSAP